MQTKIYDIVKDLLIKYPEMRGNDRLLIWNVWGKKGLLSKHGDFNFISRGNFLASPSTESIRRCRQKIQERYPELRASKKVQEYRKEIEKQKGTHIYREL